MARKKKRDDLNIESLPAQDEKKLADSGRQPRIVGWLVLIAGSFSTWYWYRPLPSTVTESLHATPSKSWNNPSGPKSVWTHGKFDIPDIATLVADDPSTAETLSAQPLSPTLLGTPNVSLIPSNDPQVTVRDVLDSQLAPYVPPVPPLLAPLPNQPSLNTEPKSTEPSTASVATNNKQWPDVGYVPSVSARTAPRSAATPLNGSIPQLLEAGMRSVHSNQGAASTQPKPSTSLHGPTGDSQSPPTRQPQFIRQPKP
jgi:hypothetical protein